VEKPLIALVLAALFIAPLATPLVAAAPGPVTLYTHGWWQPPPARRFNPFAPKSIRITGLIYERLAFWDKMKNEYLPELAVSWKVDKANNVITVKLRQNVYWHDGEKFTAKDVWTTFMIYKAQHYKIWDYIDDVKVLDDYTVQFHVKKWAYLILYYLLWQNGVIMAPYHIYGKWAEQIAKAQPSQYPQILKDLIQYEPKTIIGTGPFKFVKITSSEVVLEKFDKYWNADQVKIDRIVLPYITSNEVGWDYYRSGKLDYDVFMMPPNVEAELKTKPFAGIVKIYDMSGFALVFNFNNKWLQKLQVRQAIAYALDRQKIADAAGKGLFDPVDYPTGLLKLAEKDWIGDLISSGKLEKYSHNLDKAKQLMEAAGFTFKDGKWYTPEGQPFKLVMVAPGGWTDWVAAAQEISDELKSFGIDVELRTPESGSYWSDQWYLGGHYDLAIDFFGAWMVYPWRAYERMFIEVNNRPRSQVQGKAFPQVYTLDGEKVNVVDLVNTLAVSFDKNEQKAAAEKLALIANKYLPEYPIAEKRLVIFYNKEHFIWPDPQTNYDLWQNAAGGHQEALAFMIAHGYVKPNPKYWGAQQPSQPSQPSKPSQPSQPSQPSKPAQPAQPNYGLYIGAIIVIIIVAAAAWYLAKRRK